MRISDWSSDVCSSDLEVDNLENSYGTGSLYSAGAGARLDFANRLSLGIEAAFPIDEVRYETRNMTPRISFSLGALFSDSFWPAHQDPCSRVHPASPRPPTFATLLVCAPAPHHPSSHYTRPSLF